MKKILFLAFGIFTFNSIVVAQITINRKDFAVNGTTTDSAAWKYLTKANAKAPTLGDNQTWDYTALTDSGTINRYYFPPTSVFGTSPSVFSDATLASNTSLSFLAFSYPARQYFKLDATGYYNLGYATNGAGFSITANSGGPKDSLIFTPQAIRYSTAQQYYKFPMTANSVWKSNYKDTSNFQISVAALGLPKTPGLRVAQMSYVDTIVGWGTLKLKNPSGGAALSYAVLLQRENFSEKDSFFLGGAPAPAALLGAFGLTQGAATSSNNLFYFVGIGFNEPFITLYATPSGAVTFTSRAIIPTLGLTTDLREATNYTIATKVYPNPTNDVVNIEFQKSNNADWNVMIYNAEGKIIKIQRVSSPQGSVSERISLSASLPSGTYFYNLLDETSLIRANGKVVLER